MEKINELGLLAYDPKELLKEKYKHMQDREEKAALVQLANSLKTEKNQLHQGMKVIKDRLIDKYAGGKGAGVEILAELLGNVAMKPFEKWSKDETETNKSLVNKFHADRQAKDDEVIRELMPQLKEKQERERLDKEQERLDKIQAREMKNKFMEMKMKNAGAKLAQLGKANDDKLKRKSQMEMFNLYKNKMSPDEAAKALRAVQNGTFDPSMFEQKAAPGLKNQLLDLVGMGKKTFRVKKEEPAKAAASSPAPRGKTPIVNKRTGEIMYV